MYNQIKYFDTKLKKQLGQQGAEMVEYAIVLACIAAVGVAFYASGGTGEDTLKGVLTDVWAKVRTNLGGVL